MTRRYDYIHDGAAIYARSFAIIRSESDLSRFSVEEARIAVRMIHGSGMVEIAEAIRFGGDFARAGRAALLAGAPILCDSKMVANGITRPRLPAKNEIICLLDAPEVPGIAARIGNTRSAAALDLWGDRLAGAVVAIGNAPTALFHLLELIDAGAPMPAAVIGLPVGFVGAAESKAALAADGRLPFVIVEGRRGGSAMAVSAVNALASEAE
jgi:precorrin-8X/cobalt-precorrin-8 methylmutase